MNTSQMKNATTLIKYLDDGDAFIEILQEMLDDLGWSEGTELSIEPTENGGFVLSRLPHDTVTS